MSENLLATARLLGADDIHQLATQAGIQPTKKLGQNFMCDPQTIRRIVTIAGVQPGDQVVEVGPGLGSLTLGLLGAGAHVTTVEIDPKLNAQLPQTVERFQPQNADNLTTVLSDALAIETADQLPGIDPDKPFALVSNLPYNVATPILLTLLARFSNLSSACVLVQSEVADRLSAGPGSKIYGVPSVKLRWYGEAKNAGKVARSVFWPVPNVDSSLVSFTRWPQGSPQALRAQDYQLQERTFALIEAAFLQRRKTLRAALRDQLSAEQIQAAGIDPMLRGEKLTLEQFAALAQA
ncbi:16S rRNA (adenine(1518)-N(6)/adenine(1519)-N(6))-dimethyltransferase RsmA [Aeriscardovia aeriphila]|uniref:Ribosomal RNA small subunit methyltransferase A n=1 Tax=Aeriscardovia aeriphila TaxID=218139 RepID=A0A261F7H8_9BIFI|nr:16S rRNA (adenine(1518)-N(6)/adenine(1519)-N(6))-dimethyltransferase RsmA [Aeriscardovia aeriphila]NYI25112.1 16S rRNA (adenine1518-N6/adenine1519-N6)-dimethyltransferase [Aeriscardovia aeriphila]OZG55100.1 16S rRNA methyltransferase [Aeriscardovia aeriphila]